jgi:hypothetical protein
VQALVFALAMNRVAALALALVALGCSKRAPDGFAPALGPGDDDDATTTLLTTGIEPTGGEESSSGVGESTANAEGSGEASSSGEPGSDATTDPVGDESSSEASSSSSGAELPGDPLDPSLDVPEEGESCTTPGSLVECPGIAVCRFATTEQGLCESCDGCGNLGAACSEGTDCDILFSCYDGRCTNFCQLGTYDCGPIEDCLDIGHDTYGVCDPAGI